jgi:hypothetical protein
LFFTRRAPVSILRESNEDYTTDNIFAEYPHKKAREGSDANPSARQ